MSNIVKGLCWAAAILAIAIFGRLGLVDRDTAQSFVVTMPVLAIATMLTGRRCGSSREGERQA